jgi:hypothetical protein
MNDKQEDARTIAFVIAAPDGQSTIMCRVTTAALEQLAQAHGGDHGGADSDHRALARRFHPQVQNAALEKYRTGEVEADGTVLVEEGDAAA